MSPSAVTSGAAANASPTPSCAYDHIAPSVDTSRSASTPHEISAPVDEHQSATPSPSRSPGHTSESGGGQLDRTIGMNARPCGAQITPLAASPQISATRSPVASDAASDA